MVINKVNLTFIEIRIVKNQVSKVSVTSVPGGFSLQIVLSEVVVFSFSTFCSLKSQLSGHRANN